MKTFVNNIAALSLTIFAGSLAAAQTTTSTDITCRTKAKDIAAQAYATCMGATQTSQIEQVRKEYQKQLAELKSHYDQELKKINAKGTTALTARGPVKTKTKKTRTKAVATAKTHAPKATKGLATSLPTRTETAAPPAAAGVITSEDVTVVAPATATGTSSETRVEAPTSPTGTTGAVTDPAGDGPTEVPALPSSDDNEAAQDQMQLTLVPATSGLTQ